MDNNTLRKVMAELGRRSAAKLTPEERKERARKAVAKRWRDATIKKNGQEIVWQRKSE